MSEDVQKGLVFVLGVVACGGAGAAALFFLDFADNVAALRGIHKCPACYGTGTKWDTYCRPCGGKGRVRL